MKTNLKSYNKSKLKRKLEADDDEEGVAKGGYLEDLIKSENFEVGDYHPAPWVRYPRFPGDRLQFICGFPCVAKIYDSSHKNPSCQRILIQRLLCFSRLAMLFYNIRMGTYFRVVKPSEFDHNKSKNSQPSEFDHKKSKNSQPSDFDHNAQVVEHCTRLYRVINTYTIDSRLDSQYSLALYLSQFALVSHNYYVLKLSVAKHDIESLKVLKLVKPDSEDPTYLITFEASVYAFRINARCSPKEREKEFPEINCSGQFPPAFIPLLARLFIIGIYPKEARQAKDFAFGGILYDRLLFHQLEGQSNRTQNLLHSISQGFCNDFVYDIA
ncbi:hypothetical protein POM88_000106 [Heracleum sosnowskyi]|uniref:Uncharacterized protein n=1 Tax=Heracleum sosnowskyi TaxID=360622 RepID=A0AAD8N9F1_9APIA|nr:hypothetical protein POM88_000106 [Heracleum sosnowskyi]